MTNKYNTVNQEDFDLGVKYALKEVKKMIKNIRDKTLEIDDESCAIILQKLKEIK